MPKNNKVSKTIIFSGGGTGGSITPLLAVAEALKDNELKFKPNLLFVGSHSGPEQEMVATFNKDIASLKFIPLLSGKWRRYFSLQNFIDIFKVGIAYFQALKLLKREQADLVVSAGGFVSVPLVWATASLKIPVLIHQQDFRPGLANRLMAPFARVITVTFEKSLGDYGAKAVWIGNPVKELNPISSEENILAKYNLSLGRPLIIVVGGQTGAQAINNLIFSIQAELSQSYQVLHLTGSGKLSSSLNSSSYYKVLEQVSQADLLKLMLVADLVISRCGLATLSELSALNKAAILIPMPNSHQEDNALVFAQARAALVLKQKDLSPEKLVKEIKRVLTDKVLKEELENNIAKVIRRGARDNMLGIIEEILG